jgi:hypothetical protein
MIATAIRKHVLHGSQEALETAIRKQLAKRQTGPAANQRRVRNQIAAIDRKLANATASYWTSTRLW